MTELPAVDVNLFVHNGAATLAATIEAVLAQDWPRLTLTVLDNASTDATADVLAAYAGEPRLRVRRSRADVGAVLNCQKAFWEGDADFVMPKTADDLLAPDFVSRIMAVMLAHPDTAMCHAAGLVFDGAGTVQAVYPPEHRLHAVGPDPVDRACRVMATYTSAPSFWGIYRRAAVDRLARIPYRAGWDHALLAELALHGEIRHVPEPLFWRRDGGKPVAALAPSCTEAAQRGLPLDDALAEQRWRTPLITTAYAHLEQFAIARAPTVLRAELMRRAPEIFRRRWLPLLLQEAARFRAMLPTAAVDRWQARRLEEAIAAVQAILPDQDFSAELMRMVAAGEVRTAA